MAAFAAQQVETPAEPEPQAAAEPAAPAEPEPEIQHVDYPVGDPFAPQAEEEEPVSEPTRRINLSDLKFGRNYKGDH